MGVDLLTKAERNYHLGKAEFLALKWAVMDHFKEYLIYQPFVIHTDNNPLTYLFTPLTSWALMVASLTNFNFIIKYQCGRNNATADALNQVNESLNARTLRPFWTR